MSENKPPEDVKALLSRAHMKQYKVFGTHRAALVHPAPALAPGEASKAENSRLEVVKASTPRWSLLQELSGESEKSAGDEKPSVPIYAVCSANGGTGKTTVVATLARALSHSGENVLLVHGTRQAAAPLHFGAQVSPAGRLRTFVPPHAGEGRVHILAHPFDEVAPSEPSDVWLPREVNALGSEIDRAVVEVGSILGEEAGLVSAARFALVVLAPDMNAVMGVADFRQMAEAAPGRVFFLLNKFNPDSAFHAEVRQNLRMQLGERLLPVTIRRSDVVAEALAAGMTVLDYAPASAPAEDFQKLAAWAKEITAVKRAQNSV